MNPELTRVAARQGGVFSRLQAMIAGYAPDQIRDRLKDGRWERLRHGQYAEAVDLRNSEAWDRHVFRHRRLVHAAVNAMRPGSVVVSHYSALLLHGIPVWGADLEEVQLTRLTGRSRLKAGTRHHEGQLTPAELTEVDALVVTSVERALVENASRASFEAAVVSADAALRRPQVSAEVLRRHLETTECWPGSPTIRSAIAFADPLSESVGESRLRVVMRNEGLPRPVLQATFSDDVGFIGRVDFYFPDENTIVEFDGMVKYTDGSATTLIREKLREDRLRALGLEIVRITWADLEHPARTALLIRQAFARARRTRLAG
ncbi:type IV toxin-antitoxin system AbiEi family antitoxin domain-containing protein [Kribbella sp. NPDC056951]|uniref:type IV toxin-antitoxin system AbiEi family antitoxin domain-containing protein n=1 Tax=Kribbella sp. NPDC056951 TaxID=3345978 RepID=UPI0036370583